jgi:hypothetical protein
LVLLQSNADHVYTHSNSEPFGSYIEELRGLGSRVVGNISHWPESIFTAMNPLNKVNVTHEGNFVIESTSTIGTCVVSSELFKEWWIHDFTEGKRIIRPDNVFGPSVSFPSAKMLIPKRELFRHLDGYGHIGEMEIYASHLRPCCKISNTNVEHTEWVRTKIKSWNSVSDLPFYDSEFAGGFNALYEYISWASSYRSNFSIVSLVRKSQDVSRAKVVAVYVYYLLRRPKKAQSMIFDELFIRLFARMYIALRSLGKDNHFKNELILKFLRFIDLVHLRGIKFSLKTRLNITNKI